MNLQRASALRALEGGAGANAARPEPSGSSVSCAAEVGIDAPASNVVSRTLPPGFSGLRDALREYEAQLIAQALVQADGNQTRAAELLELPRRTLVRKLQALRQRQHWNASR